MIDESKRPKHRVAVVVFCEVDSVLLEDGKLPSPVIVEDAEIVATLAVRNALSEAGWPADITVSAYGHTWPVRAVRALELGIAAGNGYVWSRPSAKAYTEGGSR